MAIIARIMMLLAIGGLAVPAGCGRHSVVAAEGMAHRRTWPATGEPIYTASDQWQNEPVMRKLAQPVKLHVVDEPLESVVKQIADQTGARIHVNWAIIKAEDIPRDFPLAIDYEGAGDGALLHLLEHLNASSARPIAFGVMDGMVVISSEYHFRQMRYWRAGR